ncbi:MAG: hypothetical protein JOZ58_22100 [Acetobacteraceae bacterium]|nr:hypothetical protein [Acetobacteraceae bacterium]
MPTHTHTRRWWLLLKHGAPEAGVLAHGQFAGPPLIAPDIDSAVNALRKLAARPRPFSRGGRTDERQMAGRPFPRMPDLACVPRQEEAAGIASLQQRVRVRGDRCRAPGGHGRTFRRLAWSPSDIIVRNAARPASVKYRRGKDCRDAARSARHFYGEPEHPYARMLFGSLQMPRRHGEQCSGLDPS